MWLAITQKLITEFILDFLFFPFWWFTGGLKQVLFFCYSLASRANARLAPGLWFKNLFVPMFGQWDLQGRITSFFIRFVNGIIRSLMMFILIWLIFILPVAWLFLPIFVLYMFLNSLGLIL